MTKIDKFALKQIVIDFNNERLAIKVVDSKNEDELNELKELDKKGLAKFQVIDASASFIAHKGILEKLIDDLSNSSKVVSEIVNRTQKSNSLVQIFELLSSLVFRKKNQAAT